MLTILERIAITASATRDAQRAYFRERSPENLRTSKALEAQLDKLLSEHAAEASGVKQQSFMGEAAP